MTPTDADWQEMRKLYPNRRGAQGWAPARTRIVPARLAEGHTWEQIKQGAWNYNILCGRAGKKGTEYVMQFRTFVGPDLWFIEFAEMDVRSPAQVAADAEKVELMERALALGFRDIDWSRGIPVVRRAIEQAEREAMSKAGVVVPDMRLRIVR